MEDAGIGYVKLGKPTEERHILVEKGDATYQFGIDYLRDVWYSTSYLLDCKQSMNGCAKKRFENYKKQPLEFDSTNHSPANFHNSALTPTVVLRQVSKRLLSVKKEPMANAKWPICSIWQDLM